MKTTTLKEDIEAKIKQAETNLQNSYRQYLGDIEGVKLLMPQDRRHLVEELAAETDRLHERIIRYAGIYLRPYVTRHIRSLMALDKIAANDFPRKKQHTA